MTSPGRSPRPHAPISLQLVGLLLACLLAAQAISFASIILMPAPRPEIYRVAEIANALRGGSLASRAAARPMTREVVAELPAELRDVPSDRAQRALAEALGATQAQVRVLQEGPSPMWRVIRRLRGESRARGPRGPDGAPLGPPDHMGPDHGRAPPAMGPGPGDAGGPPSRLGGGRGWLRFGNGPEAAIFGDFVAAIQEEDGRWRVVRSTPESFPTDWQRRIAFWLLGGFLVVAPAGYLFARRISAPLKRFAEAAETLGRDPLAPQMTLTGPAEVGAAAHAFNEMQARLKRYIGDRTAMVGAISHDLRTPLARIRFKLEGAPPALKDSVLGDVDQMEQMIGGVLAFIRDEGAPRRRERLDLLSLVECVADDAGLMGGDVEIVDGEPVDVDGDAGALQRLFGNLVQNALKYGRCARIHVRRDGDHAVVEIADAGPGLAPDELEKVFQPFYRTDASRNLDNGGVGLGLPIARSSARAHGGDVELMSTGAGLVARVTLPAAG